MPGVSGLRRPKDALGGRTTGIGREEMQASDCNAKMEARGGRQTGATPSASPRKARPMRLQAGLISLA
jgi:hypothetical protein